MKNKTKLKPRNNKLGRNTKVVREQPHKDSKDPRVNLDNERISKFKSMFERRDSNDINWYTKNKGLFEAATRITWATISGLTKPFSFGANKVGVPGTVMGINYVPNFVPNAPIVEQCWSGIYSEIVHANSRTTKYDQTDLAIICYAGMEIFSAIVHGVRAYGLMRNYTEDSLIKPQKFIEASHFDFADLKRNFYRMWQDLEQLIVQSRQIWVPNVMPLVERRIWMNSYIYTDTQNEHSDYYMYVPAAFYKYNPTLTSVGGGLEKVNEWSVVASKEDTNSNLNLKVSWDNYVAMVQDMINALIPDQDRGIIYGDILKCYGKERLFALNQIDSSYTTAVVYNPEVLWQIENSTSMDAFPVHLTQTEDVTLKQNWSRRGGEPVFTTVPNFIMNFHTSGQPTNEMIAIASRMMVGNGKQTPRYKFDVATKKYVEATGEPTMLYPDCSGTEIVNSYNLYYNSYSGSDSILTHEFTSVDSIVLFKLNSTKAELKNLMFKLTRVAQLDWAPILYLNYYDTTMADGDWDLLSELDNWSPVDVDVIQRVHNALLNSLLGVPTL